jgi:hypothetical protein
MASDICHLQHMEDIKKKSNDTIYGFYFIYRAFTYYKSRIESEIVNGADTAYFHDNQKSWWPEKQNS